jgi:uncharacterized Zn finger protein (UPF0148 family)
MKVCEVCGDEIATKDGENSCPTCERELENQVAYARKRRQAAANRRAKEDALKSLGLVKVRGAMGGVYWE